MEDCTDLEHTFSHAGAAIFASVLSVLLMAVGIVSLQLAAIPCIVLGCSFCCGNHTGIKEDAAEGVLYRIPDKTGSE